jgi:CheY-like chemotaxis protein
MILIAEDDEDHVFFLRRALQKGKVLNPVFVVSDGEEAIAYLKGEGKFADRYEYPLPALLLLKRLRVVVLTTSDLPEDINRAYDLGANSFMVKPLEADQFHGLTEAIKGYWLWMSAAPQLHEASPTPREGEPVVSRH